MFLLPHSVCLALDPNLLWLHVAADGLTALAYYSIPLALVIFAAKRGDLRYKWVVYLFAAFVVACGTTHVMGIVTLWEPVYWLQGWLKAVTALVSVVTAVLLWPLIPKVLALPSPADLEREVAERKAAEAEVRGLNRELEERVRQRTREFQRAKEDAERANAAKTRFLAAASHDLRQPFQALRLFLEALDVKVRDEAVRPVIAMAGQALEGGEQLLHALLDISTLQAGTVKVRPVRFRLDEVMAQVDIEWRSQAEERGLELRVVQSTAEIESDPVLVKRLVRNLVANAVRYTQGGTVLVGCRRHCDRIAIEVVDTGIGIPRHALDEIFEEFTQLGNPERDRTKGLGLGLAIVRRLAELLGARLEVASV
ncbi:MAG: HAMP domain-containing sensor histidine kinase, partial [Pseudomonadota bacterium]